jgi:hypothetical protein
MRFINKIIFISILFTALFFNFPVYAEDNIQYFDEKFAIDANLNFNYGVFNREDEVYSTNRILNVGLGFRYKYFSFAIAFPIPFNVASFDFEINPYFDKIYYHAYIKYYQDFYTGNSSEKSGLDVFSSAITATYVANHENHSLSSVISLDKKQTVSNGSFLYAFGTFFSSIYSTDETMDDYTGKRQNLVYFGPGIGYSYTWVFENDIFLNLSTVVFTNLGINTNTKDFSFIPQLEPHLVFGQHKNTWSFNIKIANNSEILLKGLNYFDILTLNSFTATVSKRF